MTFQPGVVTNPKGRPKNALEFVPRVKNFMENYSVHEIKTILANKREYNKLSVTDGLIVKRLNEALDDNGATPMNIMLDRILGKPAQAVTVDSNVNVNMQINNAERQIRQLPRETIMAMKELIDNAKTSGMVTTTYTDVTEDESQ